jgi:hypothetical protein
MKNGRRACGRCRQVGRLGTHGDRPIDETLLFLGFDFRRLRSLNGHTLQVIERLR